jgi:hypothetical protein
MLYAASQHYCLSSAQRVNLSLGFELKIQAFALQWRLELHCCDAPWQGREHSEADHAQAGNPS